MTTGKPGNIANLQKATAARTAAAGTRAEAALDQMIRTAQPITFRGLATTARVSLHFLYRNAELRQRIEQLRSQQQTSLHGARSPATRPDGRHGNVVATLTGQLAELQRRHREETAGLRQALESAHGENQLLRRRLGAGSRPVARESAGQPDQPEMSNDH
jgi:hypothetical protein